MSNFSLGSEAGRAFRLVRENAVAVTFVSTAFSLIVNFVRFQRWGLDYHAVVTPSDVIVGGMNAFSTFFPYVVAAAIGLWSGRQSRRNTTSERKRIIFGIIYALPMAVWVFLFSLQSYFFRFDSVFWQLTFVPALLFFFNFLGITGDRIFDEGESDSWLQYNVSSIYIMLFLISMIFILEDLPGTTDVLLMSSDRCDGKEFVIWMGSESVVTSCQRDKSLGNPNYFIVERTGLEFNVLSRSD